MASRAEEKERRRQERVVKEQTASAQARRKRLYGFVAGGTLSVAAVVAVVIVIAAGGGGGGGSSKGSKAVFGTHYQGLQARRTAAGVPTMGEAQTVGAAHFHPAIKVYVNGKQIPVPANIGIDPSKSPLEMAGLHTHDSSGTIHNEAGTEARIGQFFAVWGVPFSSTQLGPYHATKSKTGKMWVDGKPSGAFGELQLKDKQQIVVSFGGKADDPL